MADKHSIKAIQEIAGLGRVTTIKVKEYAKANGLMTESGRITEAGSDDLEYRERKTDHAQYLAVSEDLARIVKDSY